MSEVVLVLSYTWRTVGWLEFNVSFQHKYGYIIDREFEFYEFFSFLKFNEFYEFFFGWKKFAKNS